MCDGPRCWAQGQLRCRAGPLRVVDAVDIRTRTESIRTAAGLPFEFPFCGLEEPPLYQKIAAKALQLSELGLTDAAIARRPGVTDKTATEAIRWLTMVAEP